MDFVNWIIWFIGLFIICGLLSGNLMFLSMEIIIFRGLVIDFIVLIILIFFFIENGCDGRDFFVFSV